MQTSFTSHELEQFTGTEHWYRHALNNKVVFTDGAKFVADRAGAYWLLDEIATAQLYEERVAAEGRQIWKLKVNADATAELICEDGNDNVVFRKPIPFTDFPGAGITLWFTNSTILLPRES